MTANPTLDAIQTADPTCQEWRSTLDSRRRQGDVLFTSDEEFLQAFNDYAQLVHDNPFPRVKSFAEDDRTVDHPRMLSAPGFRSYLKMSNTQWQRWLNDETHDLHEAAHQVNSMIRAQALELASQEAVPQHLVIRMMQEEFAEHSKTEVAVDRAPKHAFRSIIRGLDATLHDAEDDDSPSSP